MSMYAYVLTNKDTNEILGLFATQEAADRFDATSETCKGISTRTELVPIQNDLRELAHRITLAMEQFDPYDFADSGYTIEEADAENLRLLEEEPTEIIKGLLDAMEELMA